MRWDLIPIIVVANLIVRVIVGLFTAWARWWSRT